MEGFDLVPVDGGSPIHLPVGETLLGRGPFLGVSDKIVSRHHGLLENLNGQLRIKPLGLSRIFFFFRVDYSLSSRAQVQADPIKTAKCQETVKLFKMKTRLLSFLLPLLNQATNPLTPLDRTRDGHQAPIYKNLDWEVVWTRRSQMNSYPTHLPQTRQKLG
uniref:FHA domain-containing protein n=1 Tax=Hucho hucho TaxID=62062 RepID=A0A4W5QHP2_9TELE